MFSRSPPPSSDPRVEVIDQVPSSEVERVKNEYEADGAQVVITANSDGTWRLIASYPDLPAA